MSLFAHFHGPGRGGVSPQDFELVHARFIAMPALLWAAAIGVVVLITTAQTGSAHLAKQEPVVAEPCQCFSHGA